LGIVSYAPAIWGMPSFSTEPDLHGITRGKKLVVLVGQKKALGIAAHNDRPQRRYSGLLASLRGERRSPADSSGGRPS
jgi:hypothetical protein